VSGVRARESIVFAFLLGLVATPALAESWVDALSELDVSPLELGDARVPLEARIAQARALGRHGPAGPAIAALQAALDAEPPPPSRLREAIVLSLAERDPKALHEPLKTLLEAARGADPARDPVAIVYQPAAEPARVATGALVEELEQTTDPERMSVLIQALLQSGHAPERAVIERALCEPEAAPYALGLLVVEAIDASPPADSLAEWVRKAPGVTALRRRLREALAGSTCAADGGQAPAADDARAARLRMQAAFLLGFLLDAEALPPLRAALESPFADVRLKAARALQALAAEVDDDGKTRAAACRALAAHARIEIAPRVRAALTCQ
jgi:hypothetical protein